MNKETFREAARAQHSLLAPLEKTCLVWLARQMPPWVTSDHLTALGLASMLAAGVLYALAARWPLALLAVNVCLAVNWFGDSLDGTLARVRKKLRPRYGFYVDHMVDAFGTLFLIGGMGLSGYMSLPVAFALVVVYFLLSINSYLATYTIGSFQISFWKFSPTELRILLAIGNCFVLARPAVRFLGEERLFFDIGGVGAIIGMTGALLYSVADNTRTLFRAERI
ncbi:MAG: CDP-alcohol phosphatidyltransferase family protein [Bryobacteraceae bacterium]